MGERVVVPAPDVVMVVRHAEPPGEPPDELVPYVVPKVFEGEILDWQLTDDALAFGEYSVPSRFAAWRAEWERWWLLDPTSTIERLVDAAAELCGSEPAGPLVELAASGFESVVEPAAFDDLVHAVERVRDAVRERGAEGFGFVDATGGAGRTGLARTWSGQRGSEVIAADDHLVVAMDPAAGLSATELLDDGTRTITAITQVDMLGDEVVVTTPDGDVRLPPEHARPLAWLVPGAGVWRVRRVPEVVVWARTFVAIEEACRYATVLGLPLRFTLGSRTVSTTWG